KEERAATVASPARSVAIRKARDRSRGTSGEAGAAQVDLPADNEASQVNRVANKAGSREARVANPVRREAAVSLVARVASQAEPVVLPVAAAVAEAEIHSLWSQRWCVRFWACSPGL